MAYYRRRRTGYGSYGRRRSPVGFLKVIAVLLVIAVCATAVVQTVRLHDAQGEVKQLEQQLQNKGKENVGKTTDVNKSGTAASGAALPYQKLYPEMKTNGPVSFAENNNKAVYLTFDDGPSNQTEKILDALKEKNQRATFFVVGKNIESRKAVLKRIVEEGHTLGVHSYSHDYASVYTSVEAFLEDFHQVYQAAYDASGVYPQIFRFPGGSVNAYNRVIYQEIIAEMTRRGFVYYDWNVSGQDATGKPYKSSQLVQTVLEGISKNKHPIVLLHDAADKKATADAVPKLLDELTNLGYYSDKLIPTVEPITFGYSE